MSLAASDPESSRHPQRMYAALRSAGPAVRVDGTGILVTTRAAAEEVFRHPEVFSSGMAAADLHTDRPLIPLQIDPPEHKKYRKLLDPWFAPQQMKPLEEPVARLANELIDGLEGRTEIDFATDFSVPLPSQVVLELLGLPQADLPTFLRLKDGMIRPHEKLGVEQRHPDAIALQTRTVHEIYSYFEDAIDSQTLGMNDGLLARLLTAEVDGDRLTRNEIVDTCFLLMMAGLDTVSASLDCLMSYLADHPEHRRLIVEDPSRIPAMLEELMRWESPVQVVPRIATRDTEIAGCPVHEGEHVMVMIGSLNTDEAEFPDSQEIRWDREGNRHVVFGGGIHRCLGSNLARMELRVALRVWHARIPDYRLKPGTELSFSFGVRSTETFPMVLARARRT